jgi:histidine triad (HIT) family protein
VRILSAVDCVFCSIVAGEIPSRKVYEDERSVAIMDINPATRGHVLVLSRAHARDLHEIGDEDLAACARAAKLMAGRARERLRADGVTIMQSNGRAAWQTVFHYHVHVIPRYEGDPLVLPWRPAPGDQAGIEQAAAALESA